MGKHGKFQEPNCCIWFLSFMMFSIRYGNDSLLSIDVYMIGHTILKPHVLLCMSYVIFVFLN